MLYTKKLIVGLFRKTKKLNNSPNIKKSAAKFPLTYKRDPEDKRDYKFQTLLMEMESSLTLPSKVDHTSNLSPIKDQGQLGSCVSFAVTALKEWQEKVENDAELAAGKHGKTKIYDLSESWIYWNCKKIDPWPTEEGTSIRYAMQVLQKIGVPTENAWPYSDVVVGEPKKWASLVARWNIIDSYWRIDGLEELKAALVNGPVPIGIGCFREIFYVSSNGLVPYPADPDECYGGHAVLACAFDDSMQLIKFKNSWSSDWGDNGFGYLPYSYINDFLWDAWTCKDVSVTREMLKGVRSLL